MERKFAIPKIFCSRCLTFEFCRWNGQIISSLEIEKMKPHIDFVTTCPEKEIGLGVPRQSLRLISNSEGDAVKVVQPATGQNVTEKLTEYSRDYIKNMPQIDGIILKSESPSCGPWNCKLYKHIDQPYVTGKVPGIFGGEMATHFPALPMITEKWLKQVRLCENFFTSVYLLADFRNNVEPQGPPELLEFHTRNKLLFMAYNQEVLKNLGQLVANRADMPFQEVIMGYRDALFRLLSTPPTYTRNINVIQHVMGYFKKEFSGVQKQFVLGEIELYRSGIIPLTAIVHAFRSLNQIYHKEYLLKQTCFQPFPDVLMERGEFESSKEKFQRTGHH